MVHVFSLGRFDPTTETGILRDVRTLQMLGGSLDVAGIYLSCPHLGQKVIPFHQDIIKAQLSLMAKKKITCIKMGSLMGREIINILSDHMASLVPPSTPLVIEPTLTHIHGSHLMMTQEEIQVFERKLFFRAHILCTNILEASRLTGVTIQTLEDMKHVAEMLMTLGNRAVFLTGGSLKGKRVYDIYIDEDTFQIFEAPKWASPPPVGTGDFLTGVLAYHISLEKTMFQAVCDSWHYVQKHLEKEQLF